MTGTAIDTLTVDTTALNAWRADEHYNYTRELVQADSDLSDRSSGRYFTTIFTKSTVGGYGSSSV